EKKRKGWRDKYKQGRVYAGGIICNRDQLACSWASFVTDKRVRCMEMSYLYLGLPYLIVYMFLCQNSFNWNFLVKDDTNCYVPGRFVSSIVPSIVKRFVEAACTNIGSNSAGKNAGIMAHNP